MLKEFKAFAVRGNVVDLAVGVIIGAAFGKIVDSAVNDLIMPIVAAFIGHLDFSNFFLVLGTAPEGTAMTLDAMKKAGVPVFAYGNFITVAVNFVILAFIIFLMTHMICFATAECVLSINYRDRVLSKPQLLDKATKFSP